MNSQNHGQPLHSSSLQSSSPSLRGPLASRDRNLENNDIIDSSGGRHTRAVSRRLRHLLDRGEHKDNDENENENDSTCRYEEAEDPVCKIQANEPFAIPKKNYSTGKERTSTGRWEPWERIEFLRGLRKHGRGHWKKIGEKIPTRTTIQVKTHAQVMMKKKEMGINIFQDLDEYIAKHRDLPRGEEKSETSRVAISFSGMEPRKFPFVLPKRKDTKKKSHLPKHSSGSRPRRQQCLPLPPHPYPSVLPLPMSPIHSPVTTTTTTTTTVTTTTRGDPSHNKFRQDNFCSNPCPSHRAHPYQLTPSFDSVAAASELFSVPFYPSQFVAMFPVNLMAAPAVGQQHPANYGIPLNYAHATNVRGNSINCAHDLVDAEVQAIKALLDIRRNNDSGL